MINDSSHSHRYDGDGESRRIAPSSENGKKKNEKKEDDNNNNNN